MRRTLVRNTVALAWMLAGLDGCYSFTTLGRARTIGRHEIQAFAAPEALAPPVEGPATPAPVPADGPAAERREAIERTIARLEGLLSAIRKG